MFDEALHWGNSYGEKTECNWNRHGWFQKFDQNITILEVLIKIGMYEFLWDGPWKYSRKFRVCDYIQSWLDDGSYAYQ